MRDASMNLFQKIAEVMKSVQYLMKDDRVGTGQSSYKAISEEKVTMAVRDAMIDNGLVVIPIIVETERTDTTLKYVGNDGSVKDTLNRLTTVSTRYKLVNIDNPADFEILASAGAGVDSQDKGVGKALTYAYKYMLMRSFMIPTGDDPDKIASADWQGDIDLGAGSKNAKSISSGNNDDPFQPTNMNSGISEKQVKRLYAIAGKAGINVGDVLKVIVKDYKKTSIESLTRDEYEAVCTRLEAKA